MVSSSAPLPRAAMAQDLESRILAGVWRPGEQLPSEREICSEYGVSRPVVREVLAGLVERGLIEVRPGRGSFVREVGLDDLSGSLTQAATLAGVTARDLVIARLGLECSAVELAAARSRRATAPIRSALGLHQRATSTAELAQTDLDLHEALVAASGNRVLMLLFGAIRSQVFALMLRSHSDRTVHALGDPMHVGILEAVEAGDPETARRRMRQHLELALELFGPDLDRPIGDVLDGRGLRAAARLSQPSAAEWV